MHLVTGGSGFIGAALVHALINDGIHVRVLDDNSRGKPRRLSGLESEIDFVHGDVRDLDTMKAAASGCDTIWHLAYINGTRHFYERPDAVLDVGVRGTLNAIDAALHGGAKKHGDPPRRATSRRQSIVRRHSGCPTRHRLQ